MSKHSVQFSNPDEVEAVFYEAFSHCDIDVMQAVWDTGEVICVHPGSSAIEGYEQVIRSWSHILGQSRPPKIDFKVISSTLSTEIAVHVVLEEIQSDGVDPAIILATNVYQWRDDSWLMTQHHASLVQSPRQQSSLQ